jgi:SOS-response transcriptional repressor LexA
MLPLLMDPAATGRPRLIEEDDVEDFFVFPRSWVPHPETTTLMRVGDNSMAPLIGEGYLVAVDAAVSDPRKLQGKIVVAQIDRSITIRWLDRLGEQWALTPANEDFPKHSLRPEDRVIGRVAFWYGQQEQE